MESVAAINNKNVADNMAVTKRHEKDQSTHLGASDKDSRLYALSLAEENLEHMRVDHRSDEDKSMAKITFAKTGGELWRINSFERDLKSTYERCTRHGDEVYERLGASKKGPSRK
jgi:hypothetical protein